MRIRLHKQTHDRHLLEVLRADGTGSAVELETRSLLAHDLMHWVLEQHAGLADGVFGRIERGAGPTALQQPPDPTAPTEDPLLPVEIVVGMLQGASRTEGPTDAIVARCRDYLRQLDRACPPWFDAALVDAVRRGHRALLAQWHSLRLGGILELEGSFGAMPPR